MNTALSLLFTLYVSRHYFGLTLYAVPLSNSTLLWPYAQCCAFFYLWSLLWFNFSSVSLPNCRHCSGLTLCAARLSQGSLFSGLSLCVVDIPQYQSWSGLTLYSVRLSHCRPWCVFSLCFVSITLTSLLWVSLRAGRLSHCRRCSGFLSMLYVYHTSDSILIFSCSDTHKKAMKVNPLTQGLITAALTSKQNHKSASKIVGRKIFSFTPVIGAVLNMMEYTRSTKYNTFQEVVSLL